MRMRRAEGEKKKKNDKVKMSVLKNKIVWYE